MQASLFSSPVRERKVLRDYQQLAINAIFDYFSKHDGSPIIVMPVGSGKSLTIAEFMRQANELYAGTKFIVLTHVAELLTQNADELANQWPEASVSFYSDTLKQKDLSGDIIFAGVQSIYKKAFDLRHAPDLILIDECHTISPDGDSMYRKFFEDMRIINPHIKIIGFTGTPFRPGYGMLHKGKNALFTHIAYEIPMLELINRKHLCVITTPEGGMQNKMDTTGLDKRLGDFIVSQMSKKFDYAELTKSCIDEVIFYGQDRKKWLIFTIDIEHCGHVLEEVRSRGISAEMIHSKTPTMERNAIVDRYKNGALQCLVNVAVFTTGFNNQAIDLLVFMRPIRSPVLYIQCAGRGMRTFPGKDDCLLLDFGGVVDELGPIDQVRIKEPKGDGEGEAPMKTCESCGAVCPAGCAECPECGELFPDNGPNINTKASDAAVLSPQLKSKKIEVSRASYYRHKKVGSPDSIRVDYLCGLETYREWVCLEHTGYARQKACDWWYSRSLTAAPVTVDEALERTHTLKTPAFIHVKKIGQFHEITKVEFE